MRRVLSFGCEDMLCAATLDLAAGRTGLLIVSGGNEIRAGAHAGQARLAACLAAEHNVPVMRFDRRGVGDSEGVNRGYRHSRPDIAAALNAFRAALPLERIVAFGNCDAATALALHHGGLGIDAMVLGNPWTFDDDDDGAGHEDQPAVPAAPHACHSPADLRARYLERLKDPKELRRLFTGGVDLRKLAGGLARAARPAAPVAASGEALAGALAACSIPATVLLAARDRTARAFAAAWESQSFEAARGNGRITIEQLDSASHSFAYAESRAWLWRRIAATLVPMAAA